MPQKSCTTRPLFVFSISVATIGSVHNPCSTRILRHVSTGDLKSVNCLFEPKPNSCETPQGGQGGLPNEVRFDHSMKTIVDAIYGLVAHGNCYQMISLHTRQSTGIIGNGSKVDFGKILTINFEKNF
jgi:hypothetical protein